MEKKVLRFITSIYFQDIFAKPLARVLIKHKVNPNIITFIGLVFALLSAFFHYNGHYLSGGLFFLFALILDSTDGRVARGLNKFSEFGALLDNICDKVRSFVVVIGLVLSFNFILLHTVLLLLLYFLLPVVRLFNKNIISFYQCEPTIVAWHNMPFKSFLHKNRICGFYCGWERAIVCLVVAPLTHSFIPVFVSAVALEIVLFVIGLYMQKTGRSYENYNI